MKNNRIVVDLSKVQFGSLHYVNQEGQVRANIPLWSKRTIDGVTSGQATTVRNQLIHDYELAAYHPDYPGETMLQRAKRLDIVDKWTVVCTFQLSANHNLTYTGEKALVMWKAFNSKIFKKTK